MPGEHIGPDSRVPGRESLLSALGRAAVGNQTFISSGNGAVCQACWYKTKLGGLQ